MARRLPPLSALRPFEAADQGLFFGRTAPHRTERKTFEAPALVDITREELRPAARPGDAPQFEQQVTQGTETVNENDEEGPIRVLLVDDHAVVRRGLRGRPGVVRRNARL